MSVQIEVEDSDAIFEALRSPGIIEIGNIPLNEPLKSVAFQCSSGEHFKMYGNDCQYYTLRAEIGFHDQMDFDSFSLSLLMNPLRQQFYCTCVNIQGFFELQVGDKKYVKYIIRKHRNSQLKRLLISSVELNAHLKHAIRVLSNKKEFDQELSRFKSLVEITLNHIYNHVAGFGINQQIKLHVLGVVQQLTLPVDPNPKETENHSKLALRESLEECQLCIARARSGQPFRSKFTTCQVCRRSTKRVLRLHQSNALICSFECEYQYYIANLTAESKTTQ